MPDVKFSTVDLADVFLDNENPRHDPIDAEPEIIARLVAHEKVTNLAASIAKHGPSPLERMAVIRHPTIKGKFTVVEGNRRLCALKLLRDPKRAPTLQARKVFEDLKSTGQQVPSKLEVAVFADRTSAKYWLSLRHEGEQDGVGTRNWKAQEKARFNAQGSPTANPDRRNEIEFEAEMLDNSKIDLEIRIPLTERVGVHPRAGGGYNVEHYPEPQFEQPYPAGRWDVYLKGEWIGGWDVPQA